MAAFADNVLPVHSPFFTLWHLQIICYHKCPRFSHMAAFVDNVLPVHSPFFHMAEFADIKLPVVSPFLTHGGICGECTTTDLAVSH